MLGNEGSGFEKSVGEGLHFRVEADVRVDGQQGKKRQADRLQKVSFLSLLNMEPGDDHRRVL